MYNDSSQLGFAFYAYTLRGTMTMPANKSDARLEVLRSAPFDSWVALSEDETKIIAVGSTYNEVVAKSEKAGIEDPLLLKTPKRWLPLSV